MSGAALKRRKPKDWPHGNSVPLFWNETKPAKLWTGLLSNYRIAQCFDLSLSVPLATACLSKGIRYFGLAMNAEHAQWAQNQLNKAALACICDAQHVLHQGSLAKMLQKHFQDLTENNRDDAEMDVAPATPPA